MQNGLHTPAIAMIQPANTDEELWWKFDMAIRFEAGPSLELDLNWEKIQAHWPLEEGQQPETPGEIPDDVLAELQKIVDKLPPPKKYTKKSLKKSCVFEPLNLRSMQWHPSLPLSHKPREYAMASLITPKHAMASLMSLPLIAEALSVRTMQWHPSLPLSQTPT